jgi:ubiquitin-activating enzyme E1
MAGVSNLRARNYKI